LRADCSRRLGNLELLQQHGAPLWRAHLNTLDQSSSRLDAHARALAESVEAVNRKRKADQLAVGPKLLQLEAEWVGAVKKNLEIEAQCLRLEAECAAMRDAAEAKRRQQ
jgi:NAD-dependent oxidoreductase involved in siderophore biosynthesis